MTSPDSTRPGPHERMRPGSWHPGGLASSAAAGLAALVLYVWLAPPATGDVDSNELTIALARNGVAHPTGYPVYVLLGHLFVSLLHRLGVHWDYAANLWSALGAGTAIGLMHALAMQLVPPEAPFSRRARALVVLLPLGIFAFNPLWTHAATLAEVYSWQQAWVMGAALAFVTTMRALSETGPGASLRMRAAVWGMVCGLGLAHHLTSIFIMAPLSLVLLWTLRLQRRLTLEVVVVAVLAALLPLLSYCSLYLKALHPGMAVWSRLEPTWQSVVGHILGSQYRGWLGHFRAPPSQLRFLMFSVWPYLFAGLSILLVLAMRTRDVVQRGILWGLLAACAAQTAFGFLYGVPDPAPYFFPPLGIALASLVPVGAELAAIGDRARRVSRWMALAVVLATGVQVVAWLGLAIGRRDILIAIDRKVREVWVSIPARHGILLWGGDFEGRVRQYQLLAGERPELRLISSWEMTVPLSRERFVARYGFDPFGRPSTTPGRVRPPATRGAAYDAFLGVVARDLHEETRQPVLLWTTFADSVRIFDR